MSKVLSTMIAAAFAGATLTAVAQTAPAPAAKAAAPATPPKASAKAAAPATPPKASAKAAAKKKPLMSGPELVQCLQPDRRVVVQLSGMTPVPPPKPKPAADKPAADAKPVADAKPADAKPAAAPKPPPDRFTELGANVQGNIAWDPKSPVLKAEGMKELDNLLATVNKGKTKVQAVIVTGHSDTLESGPKKDRSLSEARAKAVVEYLVAKGIDRNMMFWEGRGASQPVPVTKFCFP